MQKRNENLILSRNTTCFSFFIIVAKGHKRETANATVVGSIPFIPKWGNEIFNMFVFFTLW